MVVNKDETEQNLATMEYQLRKDKAPALYEMGNVGFEQFKAGENGNEASGVRVFKIAGDDKERTIYGPVFYSNSNIRGDEIGFFKESDIVFPFNSKYVDSIMSHVPKNLGTADNQVNQSVTSGNAFAPPNSDKDVRSMKSAAVDQTREEGRKWLEDARKQTEKVAECLLKEGPDAISVNAPLEKLASEDNKAVKDTFKAALTGSDKFAEYILNNKPDILRKIDKPVTDGFIDFDKSADTEQLDVEIISEPSEAKTEKEAQLILTDGCAVRDRRDKVSTLYKEAKTSCATLNDSVGFVNVITGTGPKLMLNVPNGKAYNSISALIDWEDKQRVSIDGCSPFIINSDENEKQAWKKLYEEATNESITPGDNRNYVFVGPEQGQAAVIKVGNVEDVVSSDRKKLISRKHRKQIKIAPAKRVIDREEELIIPKDWKGIQLKIGTKSETFPSLEEVMDMVAKRVDIRKSSSGYTVRTDDSTAGEPTFKSAMHNLVVEKGLTENDARDLLKEAEANKTSYGYIKEAAPAGMPMQAPPQGPSQGLPQGLPQGPPQGAPQGAPQPGPATAGGMLGSSPPPQGPAAQKLLNELNQAVSSGKSDIVDLSSMGAIIEATNQDHIIKKYLGDVVTGMDRLGRILMTLYAHYDKFADAWGETETDTLAQKVSSDFQSIGETILELKEKVNNPPGTEVF